MTFIESCRYIKEDPLLFVSFAYHFIILCRHLGGLTLEDTSSCELMTG